jgi:hypothetical protein
MLALAVMDRWTIASKERRCGRQRRFFVSRRNGDVTRRATATSAQQHHLVEAEQVASSPASAAILVRKSNISHRPITHGNDKTVRGGCAQSTGKF